LLNLAKFCKQVTVLQGVVPSELYTSFQNRRVIVPRLAGLVNVTVGDAVTVLDGVVLGVVVIVLLGVRDGVVVIVSVNVKLGVMLGVVVLEGVNVMVKLGVMLGVVDGVVLGVVVIVGVFVRLGVVVGEGVGGWISFVLVRLIALAARNDSLTARRRACIWMKLVFPSPRGVISG
jgi:hypothetical protein